MAYLAASASLHAGDVFGTVIGPQQVSTPRLTPWLLTEAILGALEGWKSVNSIKIRQEGCVNWAGGVCVGVWVLFLHMAKWKV